MFSGATYKQPSLLPAVLVDVGVCVCVLGWGGGGERNAGQTFQVECRVEAVVVVVVRTECPTSPKRTHHSSKARERMMNGWSD